jgi:cytochrome P450
MLVTLIIVYATFLGLFFIYQRFVTGKTNFGPKSPPVIYSPWYFPFLGPLISITDMESAINRWKKQYGDTFTVYFLGKYLTFITNAKDAKKFYTASDDKLSLTKGAFALLGSAFPGSEYMVEFSAVPYMHTIMTPKHLRYFANNIGSVTNDYFNSINGIMWKDVKDDSITVNLFEFMYNLIVRMNSINFASRKVYEKHVEEFIDLYTVLDAEKSIMNPVVDGIRKRIGLKSKRDAAWLRFIQIIEPEIKERIKMVYEGLVPEDVDIPYDIARYCIKETESKNVELKMSLAAFLIYSTFFPAQLNTYTTAAFVLLEYIRHQGDEIGKKMQAEIDAAPEVGSITVEYLDSMEYIDACIYEVIRMRTDSQLSFRLCVKETSVNSKYNIPAGNFAIQPLTRAENLFTNPERFEPERHLSPREEGKTEPYRVLPFGRGRHPCTGERFVKLQIKTMLIQMSRCVKMELITKNFEELVNKNQLAGLSRPTKPVYVKFYKK